jgi:hypothetical protein
MNVTAHIDTSTLKGCKIVRELERSKKIVVIENPMPVGEDGLPLKTVSLEESFEKLWVKIEEHYGFDLRKP